MGLVWECCSNSTINYGCNDEYAQNYNSDANANDGSCYGYPSIGDVDLLFDGFDDYVEIINNGIITNTNNLTNDFTINLSFIKYSNVQDYEGVNLVSLGDGTINGKRLSIFIGRDNIIRVPLQGNDWVTNQIVPDNLWTDLSLSYLNGTLKLYINGSFVDQTDQYPVSIDPSSPIRIGSNTPYRQDEFVRGRIDDVVFWNRGLDDYEIEYLANELDSLLDFNDVMASYNFNSGIENIAIDISGNRHHGSISGARRFYPSINSFNNSLSFDGVDDYVLGFSDNIDNLFSGYNPFSISFWVKQSSQTSISDHQNIFGKGFTQNSIGENPTSVMIQTHFNGFCQIMLYSGQTSFIGVYGENVIDQDEWTLLTFTYDGGMIPQV